MRLPFSFLAAALVCGAVAVPCGEAAAPQDASFALRPVLYDPALTATKSYFILAAKPGATIQDRVRIVNTGGKTGTAFLYPVDATTGKTSGAVYLSRSAHRRDVGAWLSIAQPKVTLAPGQNVIVPFTVHVPRSARPGDHLGAIVAENAQLQKATGDGALRIRIKHLTIVAVELQLPGPAVGRVVATGVRAGGGHGYQYVYLHLASTGTALIKAAATLIVRDDAGHVVARRSIQLDTFVPGTAIDYPALLPQQALKPGKYTAEVRLRSSDARVPGYGKEAAPPFDDTRTFPFRVTSKEQTQVFAGAAPVTPTEGTAKPADSKSSRQSLGASAVIALLVVAVVVLLVMVLRRLRKRRAAVAPSPSPDEPGPVAATAAEKDELPGWADLLAAYDSKGRNGGNGSGAEAETAELVPVAAAVAVAVPAPDLELEPPFEIQPEPWFEPPPEVEAYEPEPRTADAAALEAEELMALIVRHDLAVAEAKRLPQEPEPKPAPVPVPARTGVSDLSATLVDASLVALATLVTVRLLKSD
jgi:WxL Interacting Protein, peptidoglycan binding domain